MDLIDDGGAAIDSDVTMGLTGSRGRFTTDQADDHPTMNHVTNIGLDTSRPLLLAYKTPAIKAPRDRLYWKCK